MHKNTLRRKIVAGNWKMNGVQANLSELEHLITFSPNQAEILICPPATLLAQAAKLCRESKIKIGGQNGHAEVNGAFTGEISMLMLKDAGATHVILGHSERRALFNESSDTVRKKVRAAHQQDLIAILCVGETLDQRLKGEALQVVENQLISSLPESANSMNTVIAYEPVWAVGSGKIPSIEDIEKIHAHIRSLIPDPEQMRILYGGSVKASNAAQIFAADNVDGGLIGGASLKASDFIPIINAAEAQ